MRLAPKVAEPHLWMADSLRLTGNYADARSEYNECLTLSDFDSKLAGQLNYNVLDFLAGFCNKETRRATEYLARPEKPGLFRNLRLRAQPRQLRFRHKFLPEGASVRFQGPVRPLRARPVLHAQGCRDQQHRRAGPGPPPFRADAGD